MYKCIYCMFICIYLYVYIYTQVSFFFVTKQIYSYVFSIQRPIEDVPYHALLACYHDKHHHKHHNIDNNS